MARGTCVLAGALTFVGVLLAAGSAWAERPSERAALNKQVEQQIAKLEERAAEVVPDGPIAEAHLDVARRHLALAHKLLDGKNARAAGVVAAQAASFLALAEGKGVKP